MKKCPECGDGFIGLERLCAVCRRRPKSTETRQDIPDPIVPPKRPSHDPAYSVGVLVAGDPCPMCGHKYRPRTPDAERQRNYRNRQKGKT